MFVALVGCSMPSSSPPAHVTIPESSAPTSAPRPALPTSVDIPAIGVHATKLMPLGLDRNGAIETPPLSQPMVLGYYTRSSPPCVPGPNKVPFALVGHIDGQGKQGVLYRLKNLKPGDTVTVGLDNGQHCTYRINKLAKYNKHDVPFNDVWGPTVDAQIRVVSCGGRYVGPPDYYEDNLNGLGVLR
jgi:Sortase domain